jgi:hypothetical protein
MGKPHILLVSAKVRLVMIINRHNISDPSSHGYVVPFDNKTFVFSFQNDTRTVFELIFCRHAITYTQN